MSDLAAALDNLARTNLAVGVETKAIAGAARRWLALTPETCIACGGTGIGAQSIGLVSSTDSPCIPCHGSGKRYRPETVELIARIIFEIGHPNDKAIAILDAINGQEEGPA